MTIIKTEKVALKNNPKIKEEMIQSFIFDDPFHRGVGVVAASPQFRLLLNLKFYHIKLVDKDFFTAS